MNDSDCFCKSGIGRQWLKTEPNWLIGNWTGPWSGLVGRRPFHALNPFGGSRPQPKISSLFSASHSRTIPATTNRLLPPWPPPPRPPHANITKKTTVSSFRTKKAHLLCGTHISDEDMKSKKKPSHTFQDQLQPSIYLPAYSHYIHSTHISIEFLCPSIFHSFTFFVDWVFIGLICETH